MPLHTITSIYYGEGAPCDLYYYYYIIYIIW